jgi:hypothetical protein
MIVERKWIRTDDFQKNTSEISYVDIWDGGLYKYERWPNDVEQVWEVLGRELTADGFIERLRSIPTWKALGLVLHQERLAVHQGEQHFETPGWRVLLLKPSSPSSEDAHGEELRSYPQENLGSKKPTSYRPLQAQAKAQQVRPHVNGHRRQNKNGSKYAPSAQQPLPTPSPQQQRARSPLPIASLESQPAPRPSPRPQPAVAPPWHDETT